MIKLVDKRLEMIYTVVMFWEGGGMVDTTDLKSVAHKGVRVRIPPFLPMKGI